MINFGSFRKGVTDRNGYFDIAYTGRVNLYEDIDINAVVTFGGLEPRVRSAKKFYLTANAVSGYISRPGIAGAYDTDLSTARGTMYANIPLEAAVLTVQLALENKFETKREDGSIATEVLPIPAVGYGPGVTRYDHAEHKGQIGLLKEIYTPDLRDTEIFVYRVADGKLIGSRWGMLDSEVASSTCDGNACLVSSMLMRGPASLYTSHSQARYNPAANMPPVLGPNGEVVVPGRFGVEFDYAYGQTDGRVPFLRAGDQAKVIAINRATGYMGTAVVEMRKSPMGAMSFVPANIGPDDFAPIDIKLRPPNLKVTVTRKAEIKQGATRTDAKNLKEYVIGFEGSGLTSDKFMEIRTDWSDVDGTPLPEDLPGFTGRLAMTVGDDPAEVTLQGAGLQRNEHTAKDNSIEDRTGFFNIRPGLHPVVVRLEDSTRAEMNHFYVHVDAQPMTRLVDFTGRPTPAGPSFSVNVACIPNGGTTTEKWTCTPRSGDQVGAGAQALAQRPLNYVPFLTAKYDDAATRRARRGAGENVPPPEYEWLYRPEMQFSLFTLDMQQVNLTNSDGKPRNVLGAETPITQTSSCRRDRQGFREARRCSTPEARRVASTSYPIHRSTRSKC